MPSSSQLSDLRRTFLHRAHDDIQALHARLSIHEAQTADSDLLNDVAQLSHRLLGSYGSFGFPAMARNFELIEDLALTQLSTDAETRPALPLTRLPDMISDMLEQAGVLKELGYEPNAREMTLAPLVDPKDNQRILFVDDDTNLHGLAEMYLKEEGYSSIVYETCARHAAAYLAENTVDAIICDWQLEGDNGLDLLRKVRSGGLKPSPRTPFIFMTVPSSKQAIERAGLYRPDGYLLKPFDAHRLHGVLARALTSGQTS